MKYKLENIKLEDNYLLVKPVDQKEDLGGIELPEDSKPANELTIGEVVLEGKIAKRFLEEDEFKKEELEEQEKYIGKYIAYDAREVVTFNEYHIVEPYEIYMTLENNNE